MARNTRKGVAASIKSHQAPHDSFREQVAEYGPPEHLLTGSRCGDTDIPPESNLDALQQLEQGRVRHAWMNRQANHFPPDDDDDLPPRAEGGHVPHDASSSAVKDHQGKFLPQNPADRQARYLQRWQKAGWRPCPELSSTFGTNVKKRIQEDERLGPIIKRYRLFINPCKMRTLLIQYPNRELGQEYRQANGQKPLELRIKPKCGVVEIDIPLNIHINFDKGKGIDYGEAMCHSQHLQQGGSYGLGGGLGVGPKSSAKDTRRASVHEGPTKEKLLENFDDANNKGHVMNKITLGGRIIPFAEGKPIYVFAAFKGEICTFTRIDAIVQVRPQFHHVDALHDREKASTGPNDRTTEDTAADDVDEGEAKAVNMAVKSAETLEDLDLYGGMSATNKLLKEIRDEPWQRLNWVDQDNQESFDIYDEHLIYQDPENAPQLVSEMTNEQYLDILSCPRVDPVRQGAKILVADNASTTAGASDTEKELSSSGIDDGTTEDGVEEGSLLESALLPRGIIRPPTRRGQVRVEAIARRISVAVQNIPHSRKEHVIHSMEVKIKNLFKNNPHYEFILPSDPYNPYYKWRITENRANRGVDPSYDLTGFSSVA